MQPKFFALEEANAALSLVKPIMRDLVNARMEATKLRKEIEDKRKNNEFQDETLLNDKMREVKKMADKIEFHINELQKLGCEIQDLQLGLVDFPCEYEGRMVFLCWQFGEERINSWHEYHTGFDGRRPIDRSFLRKTSKPQVV